MKRTLTLALATTALVAGPAAAVTWDTNDDGSVNAEEFVAGYVSAETFSRFDDDDNDRLTPKELGLEQPDEIFRAADENGNGVIEPDEAGMMAFDAYDMDEDDELDVDEFGNYRADERSRETKLDDLAGTGPRVPK